MAKKPAKKIPRSKKKVKKKKRRMTSYKPSKRKSKTSKKGKKKRKKSTKRKVKRKVSKRKKRPSRAQVENVLSMIRAHPELFPNFVIPREKVPISEYTNIEMMAAQVAERIQMKIIGPGFTKESVETQILSALIAAEQTGDINEQYYIQADLHGWTPQEVYQLWIYN